MASQAHYRYSAAVECAQSQWESVNNRVHYKMQEDGCVALVDPSHQVTTIVDIQKIDPTRLCPFEVQPTDPPQPAAQHGAQITVNKLDKSRMSTFEPSSVSAAHSSVPISKKSGPSPVSIFPAVITQMSPFTANQKVKDVANFDAMVAALNDQEQIIDHSQLFDALSLSLKLRQHVTSTIIDGSSTILTDIAAHDIKDPAIITQMSPFTATQKEKDVAQFDAMVAALNDQEQRIGHFQLIDALSLSIKLRKHVTSAIIDRSSTILTDVAAHDIKDPAIITQMSPFTATQKEKDVAQFDAMVAALNDQEQRIGHFQLIDALSLSIKLRKHVTSAIIDRSSTILTDVAAHDIKDPAIITQMSPFTATQKEKDLAQFDAMVAALNDQKQIIGHSQLIDALSPIKESVNNRVHHKMQEDGSVVLVDPNHLVTSNVEILKIDPSRLSLFEVLSNHPPQFAAENDDQTTVNKLGKSRLSPFEPASSNVSAGQHSSVPAIGKKLNPSLLSFFDQPKVNPFNKVASPLISDANKFDHQETIVVTDKNETMGSAPGSNINPSTQSNVNDDLDHHKRSSSIRSKHLDDSVTKGPSIGGTKAMPGYLKDTVSNGAKYSTKVPIPGRSGFNHFTRNAPGFPSISPIPSKRRDQHKGPTIGDTNAMPEYLKDTASKSAKYSTKVPIPGRSGFNHFTRNAPGFPSIRPIPSKQRNQHNGPSISDTNAMPRHMTDNTVTNASKSRTKVTIAARSGFDSITKNNLGIPLIPSAVPGIKNPKYEHVKPRFKPDTRAMNSEEKVMPPMKSVGVFDAPQVRSMIKSDFTVITTGARSGFDSITRNNPSTGKRRAKVPPAARSGFDNISTKNKPINRPSSTPIPFKHHGHKGPSTGDTKGKPLYSADTISNATKRRTKVPPTARSGFDNITKKNPIISDIPSALPGIKNPLYNHVPSRHEQNALERMAKSLVVIAQQSRVCFLYTTACETIQEFEVFTTSMCPELMDRPAWKLRKSYIACLKAECLTLDVGHIQWQSRLVEAHTLVTSVLSGQSAKKMHPYATFIQLAVEFFTKSNKAAEIDSKDDEKLNETFMGELLDIIFKITSFAANATATKSLKELLMEWNPPSWFSDQWPAAQQDATFFDSISWMMAMCACSSKYVEDLLIYKRLFLRLGLSPDATWNDVVRAFRRQTLALHEDKNTPEMSEEEIADRKRRYLLIDEAKNKLRDKLVGVDE